MSNISKGSVLVSIILSLFTSTFGSRNPCLDLPEETGGTGIVNDYATCAGYFSCVWGTPHRISCPEPFIFHPTAGVGGTPVCAIENPPKVQCIMCPSEGLLAVAIADDPQCMTYVLCDRGTRGTTVFTCPESTRFDPIYATCNLASRVICETAPPGTCPSGQSGQYPAEACNQFILCSNGINTGIGTCPVGLLFDSVRRQCNLDTQVECGTRTR